LEVCCKVSSTSQGVSLGKLKTDNPLATPELMVASDA
jgi:hypothetical protein